MQNQTIKLQTKENAMKKKIDTDGVGIAPFTVYIGTKPDNLFRLGSGEEPLGDSEDFRKSGTPAHNNVATFAGPGGQPNEYDKPN